MPSPHHTLDVTTGRSGLSWTGQTGIQVSRTSDKRQNSCGIWQNWNIWDTRGDKGCVHEVERGQWGVWEDKGNQRNIDISNDRS